MTKGAGKRGRPGIEPYIERLIASMVLAETEKPLEEQLPVKVLADEIRKRIVSLNEQPPQLSTLEKRISTYRGKLGKRSRQDEPWSLSTLDEFPIPPGALPKVLEAYRRLRQPANEEESRLRVPEHIEREIIGKRVNPDRLPKATFTIREAKWVARLSALPPKLEFMALIIAAAERLYELIGRPPQWEVYDKFLSDIRLESAEISELSIVTLYNKMPWLLGVSDTVMTELRESMDEMYRAMDAARDKAKAKHEQEEKCEDQ